MDQCWRLQSESTALFLYKHKTKDKKQAYLGSSKAERVKGKGRLLWTSVTVSPENQGNVSKLNQRHRGPVQPTKVIRQLGRGGARGLQEVLAPGQVLTIKDRGVSKVSDKSDSRARLVHPWATSPSGLLGAVPGSQAPENVREPPNKGPWDQSPFLRDLSEGASVIRRSLCATSRRLGNETRLLW